MSVAQTPARQLPLEKIPLAVLKKQDTDFPGHTNDKWYLVSSGMYRDSFILNNKPAVAKYDMEGKCWEQQQEVSLAQLPSTVTNNFQKVFAGYLFLSAVKIETKYKDRSLSYWVSLVSPQRNKYGYRELLSVGYTADGSSTGIFKSQTKD